MPSFETIRNFANFIYFATLLTTEYENGENICHYCARQRAITLLSLNAC